MATPVACKMALRMAGAGEQAAARPGPGAEGGRRLVVLDEGGLQVRVIHKGGELVVQQVVVERAAGLRVELQLLGHAVADSHGHAAVHLRLSKLRVDELAAVVHVDELQQLHLAQGDVDLDLRERAAEGIGVVLDLVSRFRRQMLGVRQAVERLRGKLAERHQHTAVRPADDPAVDDVEQGRHLARQLAGVLQDALLEQRTVWAMAKPPT